MAKRARRTKKAATKGGVSGQTRRGKPFPSVPLEKALQVPIKIRELNGGNPWAPADLALALGMGAKGPDFFYLTAASRDFGLTTGTRYSPTIALTDEGRETVYAPSPEVERQKKIEAFNRIELFKRVLVHYRGSDLPEMKYLGNTLEREFGLDAKYHDEFSTVFRENCKYLGIVSGTSGALGGEVAQGPSTVVVGEPSKKSSLRAFVIMPFTERNPARSSGFFEEVLRSLITPAVITHPYPGDQSAVWR